MAFQPVTVSRLNGYVKRILTSDPILSDIAVIGEIANLKFHSSGHVYFSLKDESSKLSCFLPASVLSRLRYELAEGLEITAYGSVGVFERGGTYSLTVRNIEVSGQGNLARAFQALKEKLEAEGLFDPAYKKPLPLYPKRIFVVTSPTGAAVHDLLKVIRDRDPFVDVCVYPVLVQGPDAAPSVSSAIRDINLRFPDTDLIITGRGGGSQEELWAFNEEIVARSIFDSAIPVISAVGHETDFSISDFVADKRAATPTEAAVLATPDYRELALRCEVLKKDLFRTGLLEKIRMYEYRIRNGYLELSREKDAYFEQKLLRLESLKESLENLSPYKVLERGYASLLDSEGKPVTSITGRREGDRLTVLLKDGKLETTVVDVRKEKVL